MNTSPAIIAKNQAGALGVTLDASSKYVYYTTYGDGKLMRVHKDGVGSPEVVLSGLDHPAFLTSDATMLYFTVFASGASDGALMRLAKPLN